LQRYSSTRGRLFDSQVRRNSGITNDPPVGWHAIHIIVKNGHVTLEGVVDRPMESSIAEIQALNVPGVFSVTNDLEVTSGYEKKAKEKQSS
jgi:osmotically-inducible protein OsmY